MAASTKSHTKSKSNSCRATGVAILTSQHTISCFALDIVLAQPAEITGIAMMPKLQGGEIQGLLKLEIAVNILQCCSMRASEVNATILHRSS